MCIRYQLMVEYPDTLADARQPLVLDGEGGKKFGQGLSRPIEIQRCSCRHTKER
jgi:hypothetical protein